MVLYNILIFSFGFWNIFKDKKAISPVFGGVFFLSFLGCAYFVLNSPMQTEQKIVQFICTLLGLGIMGYLINGLKENRIAQVGALMMGVVGFNLYLSNPHTPLDPSIRLDENAELLVRVKHDAKKATNSALSNLNFISGINPLAPQLKDTESTTLDDYYTLNIINGYNVDEAISQITSIEGVEWIEPNEELKVDLPSESVTEKGPTEAIVNDPMLVKQWNMEILKMGEYYPLFDRRKYKPQKQAKLFILDSGVASNHEDISSNFASHSSKYKQDNETDGNGHGTHCAGVAAAVTNNGLGIASMSPGKQWVSVSSVRVMNNFGFGTQAKIIEGMIEAVDAGADVISMSLGGRSNQVKEEAYEMAVEYAEKHNVIIVAAAGNNNGDASKIVPASSDKIIAVTAIDRYIEKAQFSNYITNTNYGIAAPGVSIMSTWKDGRYAAFDGTSMATPHVAGLIAVMRSLNPKLTTKQAYTILNKTGRNTKSTDKTGKLINPAEAIKSVK